MSDRKKYKMCGGGSHLSEEAMRARYYTGPLGRAGVKYYCEGHAPKGAKKLPIRDQHIPKARDGRRPRYAELENRIADLEQTVYALEERITNHEFDRRMHLADPDISEGGNALTGDRREEDGND